MSPSWLDRWVARLWQLEDGFDWAVAEVHAGKNTDFMLEVPETCTSMFLGTPEGDPLF